MLKAAAAFESQVEWGAEEGGLKTQTVLTRTSNAMVWFECKIVRGIVFCFSLDDLGFDLILSLSLSLIMVLILFVCLFVPMFVCCLDSPRTWLWLDISKLASRDSRMDGWVGGVD